MTKERREEGEGVAPVGEPLQPSQRTEAFVCALQPLLGPSRDLNPEDTDPVRVGCVSPYVQQVGTRGELRGGEEESVERGTSS